MYMRRELIQKIFSQQIPGQRTDANMRFQIEDAFSKRQRSVIRRMASVVEFSSGRKQIHVHVIFG